MINMKWDDMKHGNALVVHSDIYAFGGAEVVAVRVADLLSRKFDKVTVIHSGGKLDSEKIECWSGVKLDSERVQFISAGWLGTALGSKVALLKFALVIHAAMRIAHQYDLVVSTYGECAIDAPKLIQIVHYPLFLFDRQSFECLGVKDMSFWHYVFRKQYVQLCRLIARWNPEIISRQETISNTDWVSDHFRAAYGGKKITRIYPGAKTEISVGTSEFISFDKRKFGFVILGRLVPNKRVERAIEIISKVRQQGHDVYLHIVGRGQPKYVEHLQNLITGMDFITIHSNLSRKELEGLIVQQRFGIHAYEHEHFGIAPAELQRLGCIVFVHDSGGQREIARCAEQQYKDVDDAVSKIVAVLESERLQIKILDVAAQANYELTVSAFETGFENVLESVMSEPEKSYVEPK